MVNTSVSYLATQTPLRLFDPLCCHREQAPHQNTPAFHYGKPINFVHVQYCTWY